MSKEKRICLFQEEWKTKIGFIQQGEKITCTLCLETIVGRASSVSRHYDTKHKKRLSHMNTDERKEYLRKKIHEYESSKNSLQTFIKEYTEINNASFLASYCIAKNGKPFNDGEFLKDTFLKRSEHLFSNFSNKNEILQKIKDTALSARTIHRRIKQMNEDINQQVVNDLELCHAISLSLDESIDRNDIACLTLITKFFSTSKNAVIEEVWTLASIYTTTTAKDIFACVVKCINEHGNIKNKIFSITTDGAPAMIGKNREFIQLMQ